MLRATKIQAIGLQLIDGGQAVLIQDGPDWNGMRKFKCISPASCEGQLVIAAKDEEGSPLAAAFGALFDLGGEERWVVVMAAPDLAARMKRT